MKLSTVRRLPLLAALVGAVSLLLSAPSPAVPISPAELRRHGYVNDFAQVVDEAGEQQLAGLISLLDQKSKAQITVVTLESLEGEPIEDFTRRLFEVWGIGHKDGRGALLLLVIRDRQARLEVGSGLQRIIPDGFAGNVLRQMRPALREQKYGEALYAGALLLAERIAAQTGVRLEGEGVSPLPQRHRTEGSVAPVLLLIGLLLFGITPWWMPGLGFGYRRRHQGGATRSSGFGGFGGYDSGGLRGGFGGSQ